MSSIVRLSQLMTGLLRRDLPTKGLPAGVSLQNLLVYTGTGTPESVVTAPIGAIYLNKSGGAATTLYVKTTGVAATGWTAK